MKPQINGTIDNQAVIYLTLDDVREQLENLKTMQSALKKLSVGTPVDSDELSALVKFRFLKEEQKNELYTHVWQSPHSIGWFFEQTANVIDRELGKQEAAITI